MQQTNFEDFIQSVQEGNISDLEIYNYLEEISSNFEPFKVRLLLCDIDYYYHIFLEEIIEESQLIHLKNGWDIPEKKIELRKQSPVLSSVVTDYEAMRNRTHLGVDYGYVKVFQLLKSKIKRCSETSTNKNQNDIPDELNTDKAKELFNRAIDAGIIEKTESGYIWKGGQKYLLAYFSEKASMHLNLRRGKLDKDENQTISWSTFEKCFDVKCIKSAKNDWMKNPDSVNGFYPPGREKIDSLFYK